jgi:hypothetical protein
MTAPPPGTARRTVRIAMNGVTGRMGYRQHLVGSILAIRERGGVPLGGGEVVWAEPMLGGRGISSRGSSKAAASTFGTVG